MENISCKIIEDLLPLYVDGVGSEESHNAVAAHLETCSECRKKHRLKKLSDIGDSKTKANYRVSAFCIIFYALFAISLIVLQVSYEKAYLRYEMSYMYAFIVITSAVYLLFGMFLAFLANRHKGSIKTKILELVVIGLPTFLMTTSLFAMYILRFRFPRLILENAETFARIGSILLGCEIFRAIAKK